MSRMPLPAFSAYVARNMGSAMMAVFAPGMLDGKETIKFSWK